MIKNTDSEFEAIAKDLLGRKVRRSFAPRKKELEGCHPEAHSYFGYNQGGRNSYKTIGLELVYDCGDCELWLVQWEKSEQALVLWEK